jgi:hypothetical protein
MGVSGKCRAGRALVPGEEPPGILWTGGWVGPRAGLDIEALAYRLFRVSNLDRPVVQPETRHYTD